MTFSEQDIASVASILGPAEDRGSGVWFWNLRDAASGRVLALTVSIDVAMTEGDPITIVSALTHQGYVELHGVTRHLCIEPDEVMFVTKTSDVFSSLVVGKTCTCSQYGNIRASLLRADLTELDPAVLMAAMQLSLAESLLESLP